MRRKLALTGQSIAASRGHNEKTPGPIILGGNRLGVMAILNGARTGSPGGPYNQPGGVRHSGAPLKKCFNNITDY